MLLKKCTYHCTRGSTTQGAVVASEVGWRWARGAGVDSEGGVGAECAKRGEIWAGGDGTWEGSVA